MKQSETTDKRNILNLLKFYESIGIDLQINFHQSKSKNDLLELTKHNTEENFENFTVQIENVLWKWNI